MKSRNAASSSTTKIRGMGQTPAPLMMQINEGARKLAARFSPRTSEAQFSGTGEFANPVPIWSHLRLNTDRGGSVEALLASAVDRAPRSGVRAAVVSRSPAGLAGYVRLPLRRA